MSAPPLDPRLRQELEAALKRGLASGELMAPHQVAEHIRRFRDRFGPDVLRALDGEALLRLMHGRQDGESRCLAYWLEYKNDDEFAGTKFGGIGGGAALKFGIYQRQSDGAWIGSARQPQVLTAEDAVGKARRQRNELLAGDEILKDLDVSDASDEVYAHLQTAMATAAPDLSQGAWSHKYWSLIHPDKLDPYHSP
jgi:5-methylcytosine-specific restriction protein B